LEVNGLTDGKVGVKKLLIWQQCLVQILQ